jgi:hypothetical protein
MLSQYPSPQDGVTIIFMYVSNEMPYLYEDQITKWESENLKSHTGTRKLQQELIFLFIVTRLEVGFAYWIYCIPETHNCMYL